jgi:MerR family copper efflux transcriptional regulator
MIRHYERLGLIPAAERTAANYRLYSPNAIHTLRFVGRARSLGFSIPDIRELLALWQERGRQSADVQRIALSRVGALAHLAERCHGDERPECPILDDLAEDIGRPVRRCTHPTLNLGPRSGRG